MIKIVIPAVTAVLLASSVCAAQQKTPDSKPTPTSGRTEQSVVDIKNLFTGTDTDDKEPTYINSNSLSLKMDQRIFQYSGNVQVKRGDMTMTSDLLEGKYSENNELQELVARKNVVITKGDSMKAKCERAVYDARTHVVTLTDNPELEQNGSALSADAIKVFMDENRSVAEGQVRVKVINAKNAASDAKQAPK